MTRKRKQRAFSYVLASAAPAACVPVGGHHPAVIHEAGRIQNSFILLGASSGEFRAIAKIKAKPSFLRSMDRAHSIFRLIH